MEYSTNLIAKRVVPTNEPILAYAPGDRERSSLKETLDSQASETIEIPCIIGGKEVRTGKTIEVRMPHDHRHVLARAHLATESELEQAVRAARAAKPAWEAMSWSERAHVFLRAADLLSGPWRDRLNAATMLGQSKNAYQAEIDSACELIDFFRFNAYFYSEILEKQPISSPGIWNRFDWRPLEGFVLAITPFNFTAIGGNLPSAPAMCGNTVIWKPANTQLFSAYFTMKLLEEAGLPPGVINFVPSQGVQIGKQLVPHTELAGVHFTGSTSTFHSIYKVVGDSIGQYKSYPRLVGETGGKDFIFAHQSADREALVTGLVRGAFEYQGQKCSAASRAYIPSSIWPEVKDRMVSDIRSMKMGDVRDFSCFINAVIDRTSFDNLRGAIEKARMTAGCEILCGGGANDEKGYFIDPTVIVTSDPKSPTMVEELFGPVLTIYVYDDARFEETLGLCDTTSPYALTGAVFAKDRSVLTLVESKLRHAAGNFYINDKPTGAVVGQQPFGGSRASGTNDKAGSFLNILRWLSPRTIKENLNPPKDYRYPFMSS